MVSIILHMYIILWSFIPLYRKLPLIIKQNKKKLLKHVVFLESAGKIFVSSCTLLRMSQ